MCNQRIATAARPSRCSSSSSSSRYGGIFCSGDLEEQNMSADDGSSSSSDSSSVEASSHKSLDETMKNEASATALEGGGDLLLGGILSKDRLDLPPEASRLDEDSSSTDEVIATYDAPPSLAPLSIGLASIDELPPSAPISSCNACPHCDDVCSDPFCQDCAPTKKKRGRAAGSSNGNCNINTCKSREATYTMCQVRRHNTKESAWLVCGDTIYDATPFLEGHPGGTMSMLRKSGGAADISEDMKMHSRKAVKMMKGSKVGRLCPCPGETMNGNGDGKALEEKKFECVIS
mmetsp:Transcript_27571/g.60405  ORF Transcript_27571/g.60405 Transcript_27571/m.60405 type:complete len:290 (-) Transcript_27571:136-1005(-)